MFKLISVERDAKTIKGSKLGVLTGILYLSPAEESGYQTCPKASAGCKAACLYTAGYAGIYPNVNANRIRKTLMFFQERIKFFELLVKDIEQLIKLATVKEMDLAVRLNGTSDIAWEKFSVVRNGVVFKNIFAAFSEVQFYDYTKVYGRKSALNIPNYSLTFSLAEDNDKDATKALNSGMNVAVVFNVTRTKALPEVWSKRKVIDGDVSDLRYKDGGGNIIGLRAKGKARKDTSGFVRKIDSVLIV